MAPVSSSPVASSVRAFHNVAACVRMRFDHVVARICVRFDIVRMRARARQSWVSTYPAHAFDFSDETNILDVLGEGKVLLCSVVHQISPCTRSLAMKIVCPL